jgi:hypothetical protein
MLILIDGTTWLGTDLFRSGRLPSVLQLVDQASEVSRREAATRGGLREVTPDDGVDNVMPLGSDGHRHAHLLWI